MKTFSASNHSHVDFVKQLKNQGRLTFIYNHDFYQNDILYWIGTNGKDVSEYTNPHLTGLVTVDCFEVNTILLLLILVIFFFPVIEH